MNPEKVCFCPWIFWHVTLIISLFQQQYWGVIYITTKCIHFKCKVLWVFINLNSCATIIKSFFSFHHSQKVPIFWGFFSIIAILMGVKWSNCGFDLHFPNDSLVMLNIFLCAYWPFVYLLWRSVYSNTLPIYVQILLLFVFIPNVVKAFIMHRCWILKYF